MLHKPSKLHSSPAYSIRWASCTKGLLVHLAPLSTTSSCLRSIRCSASKDASSKHPPILIGSSDDEGCFFAQHGAIPVGWEDIVTAIVFTCPVHFAAQARAQAGVSAWQYRYFGRCSHTQYTSCLTIDSDAYPNTYAWACPGRPWHGSELLQLFGKAAKASRFSDTAMERDLGWSVLHPSHYAFVKS